MSTYCVKCGKPIKKASPGNGLFCRDCSTEGKKEIILLTGDLRVISVYRNAARRTVSEENMVSSVEKRNQSPKLRNNDQGGYNQTVDEKLPNRPVEPRNNYQDVTRKLPVAGEQRGRPAAPQNKNQLGNNQPFGYTPTYQMPYTYSAPAKKNSSKLLIIVAVCLLAIAVAAVVFFIFRGMANNAAPFGTVKTVADQGDIRSAADLSDTATAANSVYTPDESPVCIGSYDQYQINIFLSNFSELVPIYYSCDTIEDKMMFVMKHKYVNGFDVYVDGDIVYLSGQKMRNNLNYFFRSSVRDESFGAVAYDEDDDSYWAFVSDVSSDGAVSYGKPYRFSVAENAVPVSDDSYQVSYSIYESPVLCDDDCYSMTPYEAASDPDLKKIGNGEALLGIDQEGLYFR